MFMRQYNISRKSLNTNYRTFFGLLSEEAFQVLDSIRSRGNQQRPKHLTFNRGDCDKLRPNTIVFRAPGLTLVETTLELTPAEVNATISVETYTLSARKTFV